MDLFDGISGEPTEFERNIFPGFDTLQLYDKVKDLLSRLGETPENFTGRIICMSMLNDISCASEDNEQECMSHAKLVSLDARRFGKRTMVIYLSWFWKEVVLYQWRPLQGVWDNVAERMLLGIRRKWLFNFPRYDSIVQRSTQKKQRTWKAVDTLCSRFGNDWD